MSAHGITIPPQTNTLVELADLLEHVADQLRDDMTSGYYPHWTLTTSGDIEPDTDATFCRWCGEEIGLIHYGDGDRWQPTPALGDDFCEARYDAQDGTDPDSGEYRHEPEGEDA